MGNNLIKKSLAVGIISLFIVSSVTPMVIGYTLVETSDREQIEQVDDIAFEWKCKYRLYNTIFPKRYYPLEYHTDEFTIEGPVETSLIESKKEEYFPTMHSAGPMNSAWPMKCHDRHHTGRSPYSTADNPLDEKWRFKTGGWVEGGPVIDNDGIIYFGDFDAYLYAVYPDGSLKWKYKLDGWIWSTPAIGDDGTIYVGDGFGHKLQAINPNGTRKWKFSAGGTIYSSPAIADDGTVYFGTMRDWDKGDIIAVNPNGTEKWRYTTGYWIVSDPAIGDDGTIYIGSCDNYLYAMNPNGTLKWRFETGDWVKSHPSIADDGTIYFGSFDGNLYALYQNGTMKWKFNNPGSGCVAAVIAEDGTLYLGGGKLYAINPNGVLKWSFNLGNKRYVGHSSPAIAADGTIFVGVCIGQSSGGEIIALNPDGSERWRSGNICNDWIESSPCIGSDGTVYIGSCSTIEFEPDKWTSIGYLHAFNRAELEAHADGAEHGLINVPIQFNGSASGGYSPYSWHWDFGDETTSTEQNPAHIYTNPGNYTITLTVTDDEDNTSSDTIWIYIQETNSPPNTPTIDGPTSGKVDTSCEYTFSAIDPDGNDVYFYIEWGDGTDSRWIGPYNSGEKITKSHKWSEQGNYTIKAKAKDVFDEESEWATLEVSMPKNKIINPFERFLENHPLMFPLLRQLLGL
jgi:outer membrane protein assembly factor BamB